MKKRILVTGATGFIGSHLWLELLKHQYQVIGIDNFSNSQDLVLSKIAKLSQQPLDFQELDLINYEELRNFFATTKIAAVIHLAALKSVADSVSNPIVYYHNNLTAMTNLLRVMEEFNCKNFIYSSSATVYGAPQTLPLREEHPLGPTNPYGQTKAMGEYILRDLATSSPDFKVISLRYFNPAGAHPSGSLGEEVPGKPANLFPAICRAVSDPSYELKVFGKSYDTQDGTAARDIIHISDLVAGHLAALEKCLKEQQGFSVVNLGTGRAWTVLEIIQTFEKAWGSRVPYEFAAERPGDIPVCYAAVGYAKEYLGWEAQQDLWNICMDSVNFLRRHQS